VPIDLPAEWVPYIVEARLERSYISDLRPLAALTELRRCAGSQFDPAVVDAFALVVGERERTQSATK